MTTYDYESHPLGSRLFTKIQVTGFCWLWVGKIVSKGYGQIHTQGRHSKRQQAHRAVYEYLVGPIPNGLQLDHLCRNRACVNPDHLEPVTGAENMRRSGPYRRRQWCKKGLHDLTKPGAVPGGGRKRICVQCRRERHRIEQARYRADATKAHPPCDQFEVGT